MENRIEEIKERRFFLAMKDVWSREDFKKDDEYFKEYMELKRKLAEAN